METDKDSVSQRLRQHIALWVNALAVGLRHLAQNDPSAPAVLNELGKTIAANAAQYKSPRLETTAMELASAAGETLQRAAQELIELLRSEGTDAVREGRLTEVQPRELTTEQTATSAREPESHPASSRAMEAAAPANLMELEEFRSAFDRTLRRCVADNMPAAFVLLVIDSANSILASQGPAELERIVLATASLMAQSFRRTDLLTRCGLSDFLVLLPGEESFGAMRAVQKVMTVLNRIPCTCTGEKSSGLVTCSAGIVILEVETTLDAAMAAARECLKEAQAAGGGRVIARDPTRGKQKHRILLVGPNDLTGRVLKGVLEKEGYEVAQTATAAEAGRLTATQVCNLVITYGAVPDGDPAAIAARVRQVPQHGRVPVLALLADNTPANIVRPSRAASAIIRLGRFRRSVCFSL
ncbi:MAG: diguanylate cyclase domain-containing protein [Kiritimatiellia bacterium]